MHTVTDGSRPTTYRRTKAEVAELRAAMHNLLRQDHPMTVRQVFYRLVGLGLIAKTETEYKHTVVRLLGEMRLSGDLPYGWIADHTRWMRKPQPFGGLHAALRRTAETYRRALWADQDAYVEIWLEKDALDGVLSEVTAQYDVPLMVTRGYPSLSFLHEAASAIASQPKLAYLYYFGDHDPSGVDISRVVETRIREFSPKSPLHFERVAVLPEQIARWDLPTRPTKAGDSRGTSFVGGSVEVDAIPPKTLRGLVTGCIEQHIDQERLEKTQSIERMERTSLIELSRTWEPPPVSQQDLS